jgi:hypothetical protein
MTLVYGDAEYNRLEIHQRDEGLEIRQFGNAYIAREWRWCEDLSYVIQTLKGFGLTSMMQNNHPQKNAFLPHGNGRDYLAFSSNFSDIWISAVDEQSPKTTNQRDNIQTITFQKRFKSQFDKFEVPYVLEKRNTENLLVDIANLEAALTAVTERFPEPKINGKRRRAAIRFECLLRRWKFEINGDPLFSCSESEHLRICSEIDTMFQATGSVGCPTSHTKPWDTVVIDFYKFEHGSIAFIVESDTIDLADRLPKCLFRFEWSFDKGDDERYAIKSSGYSTTNFDPAQEDENQIMEFENQLISELNNWLESIIEGEAKLTIVAAGLAVE